MGCASTQKHTRVPGTDLSKLEKFYVAKQPKDERGVDVMISDRLSHLGYVSAHGGSAPDSTSIDAIVTYEDKWWWDITMYMIELTIHFREPDSNMVLATGHSMRTSLVRKSPGGMVEEVLTEIFKDTKQ
jgi:hypothetical protein